VALPSAVELLVEEVLVVVSVASAVRAMAASAVRAVASVVWAEVAAVASAVVR
jgi:hypothetical protein